MYSLKEPKTGFAAINATNIYFEAKGNGKALLLLHAGVGDSRMWDFQFEGFSRTYFVIRCDLRGFGRTRMQPGFFSYQDDIAALLRHLGVEHVAIIGASFGGKIAIDFALTYPEMLTALILVDPALGGYTFESEDMLAFLTAEDEALERNDIVEATELNLKMWVNGNNRNAQDVNTEVRERVREMQLNIFSQPEITDVEEKELSPPAIERLEEIKLPTLVIVGDKDVAEFQAISKRIAERIQNARHMVIQDAAHLPNMERPQVFNQIVLDFLR